MEDFIGPRENEVTNTCAYCRTQKNAQKSQALNLRNALRNLFAEAAEQ
jgi:hypothetical protein